ncbi:MAG: membrane protein insertion efficiency factor YidD [Verrucomicrobiota bacterium]
MARILVWAIKFYKDYLSRHVRTSCIYTPSCSEYGIEAIRRHGACRGLKMAIARLLRCTPSHGGGDDPAD